MALDPTWAVQVGSSDLVLAHGITYDGAGGAYVTGLFNGNASFGSLSLFGQGLSSFVTHVNASSGVIDWAIKVFGTSEVHCTGIAADGKGGALVTGYFAGSALFGSKALIGQGNNFDAFVMHVTASGSIDWAVQTSGTSLDVANGIAHDGAGGALVTGVFSGVASFGGTTKLTALGKFDAFVMHVTASGVIDWAVQAGGTPSDSQMPSSGSTNLPSSDVRGRGIAHDGAGGAFVTGCFNNKAVFGSTMLVSQGLMDAFVMHVTASGAIDWAVQAGGASFDLPNGIAYDGVGGAFATGYFSNKASFGITSLTSRGSSDAFVMHVTASGAIDWAVQAGGTDTDQGNGIASDGAGGALVTGYFTGTALFDTTSLTTRGLADAFVMHVTAAGAIDWAVQAGGTSFTEGYGISYDGCSGGALVTGQFIGMVSFGSTSLTSSANAVTCFAALLMPPPPRPREIDPYTSPSSPAVMFAALAASLALLLGLLLACGLVRLVCGYRRQRRMSDHLRASRDRAQMDLQMLEHRFKQRRTPPHIVYLIEDSLGHVPPRRTSRGKQRDKHGQRDQQRVIWLPTPTKAPPSSIPFPQGISRPPSPCVWSARGSKGGGAGSAAAGSSSGTSSRASPDQGLADDEGRPTACGRRAGPPRM